MKNITTIERIAMQKTAIKKTAMEKTAIAKITAKITTTALLLFLLLFTLTTNLKAQAVQDNSKSGFFAGFVVLDGFQVDSTKSITTSETTSYRVTHYSNEINEIRAYAHPIYATSDLRHIIETLLKANCETGATDVIIDNINTAFSLTQLDSFDEGSETGEFSPVTATGDGIGTVSGFFPTGTEAGETSYCRTYFYGGLAAERTLFTDYEVTADSGTPQLSAESDKLNGIGLQFGYRGEKWRASFTHYTGTGGDHELTNSLVILADYFFGEIFC